jgi:replicative DNA helicase
MVEAPRDKEAEQVVLASIILDEKAIYIVSDMLQETDFYEEHHRMAYHCMLQLQKDGIAIDHHTIKAELQRSGQLEKFGGISALSLLTDGMPKTVNVKHYCSIVRRTSVARSLMQLAVSMHTKAAQQEDGPQELIEKVQGKLMELYGRYQSAGLRPMSEIAKEGFRELEERKSDPAGYGIKTGFLDIDHLLGSMRPQNSIVLAARPGGGKTALAINIADNVAASGKRVAIFSLEMSQTELYCRLIGAKAHLGVGSLLQGSFAKNDWPAITAASGSLEGQPICIDDSGSITTAQIWARCKREQAERGLDLVIIDYLQLVEGPGRSLYEKVTAISKEFKKLAKDLKIPVVSLCQQNREVEKSDRDPQLSDLRDSGSIEQDADVVMFLWSDDGVDLVHGKVAKQRNGPVGKFDLGFDRSQTRFFNCSHSLFEG